MGSETYTEELGGFYVVMSDNGFCWTGEFWASGWKSAKQFPPGPGFLECEDEARRAADETGLSCAPTFIQPHQAPAPLSSGRIAAILRRLAKAIKSAFPS